MRLVKRWTYRRDRLTEGQNSLATLQLVYYFGPDLLSITLNWLNSENQMSKHSVSIAILVDCLRRYRLRTGQTNKTEYMVQTIYAKQNVIFLNYT